MRSPQWVQDIVTDVIGPAPFKIGDTVKHPDGRSVRIISGYYLDPEYKRLSNFWYWREVLKDGSLAKKEESGYGWTPEK